MICMNDDFTADTNFESSVKIFHSSCWLFDRTIVNS